MKRKKIDSVKINDYTGDIPSAPDKIDSRGVTRGAYRGYGEVYDVSIPSGTIVEGSNTVCFSLLINPFEMLIRVRLLSALFQEVRGMNSSALML